MLQYLNQKRGQSTLEYAILIVVIIAALLSIQVYLKRSIQGKIKSSADDIGDQYSDGNTNVIETTIKNASTEESFNAGSSTYVITNANGGPGEQTNYTKNSIVDNTAQEYWGTN